MKIFKYAVVILSIVLLILLSFPTENLAAQSIDNIFKGADNFIEKGNVASIDTNELHDASNFVYNAFFGVAMVASVVIGMILGIKYMISDSEGKAKYKETLVPYVISVIVMFGTFTIWKIVIDIMS